MRPKHQRLMLISLAGLAMAGATALAVSALGDKMLYFYAPADIAARHIPPGQTIRLGGLVADGSVKRLADGLTMTFVVTDFTRSVAVRYTGVAPDLFREGQGVVADGAFDARRIFVATTLLAKHDEKYMPPDVAAALKKSGKWKAGQAQSLAAK